MSYLQDLSNHQVDYKNRWANFGGSVTFYEYYFVEVRGAVEFDTNDKVVEISYKNQLVPICVGFQRVIRFSR